MRSVRASWHLHEGRLQVSSDTVPGRRRDYIEIYELDDRKRKPRSVDDDFISDVKAKVRQAAEALRTGYAAYRADAEEVRILRLSWHVHGRLSRRRSQLTRKLSRPTVHLSQ